MLEKKVQLQAEDENTSEEIICSAYSSFEEVAGLYREWDSFIASIGGEIFLTFDWCRIWWNNYGQKRKLKLFILRKNGKIVGLIPMFFERVWGGPFPVRIAKIVGSDFTLPQFTLPVQLLDAKKIVQKFLEALDTEPWDLCCFWPLTCLLYSSDFLTQVFADTEISHHIEIAEDNFQTIYDLPKSWDEYLKKLNKHERKKIRKNYNKIKARGLTLESVLADAKNFETHFQCFVDAHQNRWRLSGRPGHFGDWPKAFKFHREVAAAQMKLGRLQLLKVQAVGDIGYRYSFDFGQRSFAFLVGRSLSSSPTSLDLGRLLFSEQTQQAIANGIINVDSMRGRYEYKLHLGGRLSPLAKVRIIRHGPLNTIRIRIVCFFFAALDLFYYKIWYCRIAPRLPFSYGPLWSIWIKTNDLYSKQNTAISRFRKFLQLIKELTKTN